MDSTQTRAGSHTRSVVVVFVDGLGIGVPDPAVNPLAAFRPKILRFFQQREEPLPLSGLCLPTDAVMGTAGLPQSATGQTSLFTGINASARTGRHLQGFPNQALRTMIASQSLFRQLKGRDLRVTFANAYTPPFFRSQRRWESVTTVMCRTSGTPLRDLDSLLAGDSLFMDFSNRLLRKKGFDVPLYSPAEAAAVLARLTLQFDLCLYEYFLTDWVGHRGTQEAAVELLQELDEFLWELLGQLESPGTSLLVTSDHGNVEDMSHSLHTCNPVPTLLWGDILNHAPPATWSFELQDVTPLLVSFLAGEPPAGTGTAGSVRWLSS